jgi:hypothetical protein
MSLAERLAAFPAGYEYSAACVADLLSRCDISRAAQLASARVRLQRVADEAVRAWRHAAEREGVPILTLFRGLIAAAKADDLPVYRILLDWQGVAGLGAEVRDALPGIQAQLGPVGSDWHFAHVLLCTDRRPTMAELEKRLAGDPHRLLRAVLDVAEDRESLDARTFVRLLTRLTPGSRGRFLRLKELQASEAAVPLPRLSVRQLNRLPLPLRREILASAEARSLVLAPAVAARIQANPRAHPETPESIRWRADRLAARVRSDLARRQVTPAVTAWIELPDVSDRERKTVLWAGIDSPRRRRSVRDQAAPPGTYVRDLGARLGVVLPFLAAPAGRRLEAVPDSDAGRHLAHRFSGGEWLGYLMESEKAAARDRAVRLLARAKRLDVLRLLIARALRGDPIATQALHRWRIERPRTLASLAVRSRALARVLATELDDDEASARYLDQFVASGPVRQATDIAAWILDGCRTGRPRGLSEPPASVRGLVARLARAGRRILLRRLVRGAAGDPSGELLDFLFSSPTGDAAVDGPLVHELATVFGSRAAPAVPEDVAAEILERWVVVAAAEALRLTAAGERVPDRLGRLIARAGRDRVLELLRKHPRRLLPFALRHVPLRDVLRQAFREPEIADAVDHLVPRERLRRHMGWVRREWRHAPAVATAREVALAFSLRDTPFLTQLTRRAGPPAADQPPGRRFDDLYRTYPLPKRSGGVRIITAPSPRLKRLQRRLLDAGFAEVALHPAATGFRAGSSTLENAARHVGKQLVVNVDIESFFPRTSHALIVRACGKLADGKLSRRAVRFVADLCSFQGALPTGAPTSPAIGNIVLTPVDRSIETAASRFGVAYSRYADDLTFSGGDECPRILPFVEQVLGQMGYQIKRTKVNLFRKGRRQVVTGLVVNEKPNLPKRTRRRLRAAVHQRVNGGQPHWHGRPISDQELFGRLAVLNPVQPEEARRLRSALRGVRGSGVGVGEVVGDA